MLDRTAIHELLEQNGVGADTVPQHVDERIVNYRYVTVILCMDKLAEPVHTEPCEAVVYVNKIIR